jgi:hypothetical protein
MKDIRQIFSITELPSSLSKNPVSVDSEYCIRLDTCLFFSQCLTDLSRMTSGKLSCHNCNIFKALLASVLTRTDLTKCDCYTLIIKYVSELQRVKEFIGDYDDNNKVRLERNRLKHEYKKIKEENKIFKKTIRDLTSNLKRLHTRLYSCKTNLNLVDNKKVNLVKNNVALEKKIEQVNKDLRSKIETLFDYRQKNRVLQKENCTLRSKVISLKKLTKKES